MPQILVGDGPLERYSSLSQRQSSAEAVRRVVSALPEKYRDALVLFYFHEMDVAAASESLGVAEGTLKARLHRGRNLLRDRLSKSMLRTYRTDPETV